MTTTEQATTEQARVPLIVNGEPVEVSAAHSTLLGALREELGLTAAKDGCAPSGQCGCCTVLIDGKARISCQTPLDKVAGKEITTLEGFDPAERDRHFLRMAAPLQLPAQAGVVALLRALVRPWVQVPLPPALQQPAHHRAEPTAPAQRSIPGQPVAALPRTAPGKTSR